METVVLFADISGFTNLSEACAKNGVRGNEDLAFVINRYMESMVKFIGKYGGDIIKFVGDALIVMWPGPSPFLQSTGVSGDSANLSNSIMQAESEGMSMPQKTIRKAIQCAIEIQNNMHNIQLLPGLTLSVKVQIKDYN